MASGISLPGAALRYPIGPRRALRAVIDSGRAAAFAAVFGLAICILAGFRAGMMASGGGVFSWVRFASSLFGFLLLPAIALLGGRWLGGRGRFACLAAAVVGSGLPFLVIDALWIGWAALGSGTPALLVWLERASWLQALVLLVAGIAEAQQFTLPRALANVGLVVLALALVVAGAIGLRTL